MEVKLEKLGVMEYPNGKTLSPKESLVEHICQGYGYDDDEYLALIGHDVRKNLTFVLLDSLEERIAICEERRNEANRDYESAKGELAYMEKLLGANNE